jgi:hypothetical protein
MMELILVCSFSSGTTLFSSQLLCCVRVWIKCEQLLEFLSYFGDELFDVLSIWEFVIWTITITSVVGLLHALCCFYKLTTFWSLLGRGSIFFSVFQVVMGGGDCGGGGRWIKLNLRVRKLKGRAGTVRSRSDVQHRLRIKRLLENLSCFHEVGRGAAQYNWDVPTACAMGSVDLYNDGCVDDKTRSNDEWFEEDL